MIKRAVIGHLIQWSSHSWYDILFLCNYAAPTAPHVFIASSTHVKLKSSLCTWYLIIACCTAVHNGKMSKLAIYRTWSSSRQPAITEQHSCTYAEALRCEFKYWLWMETLSGSSLLSWFLICWSRYTTPCLLREDLVKIEMFVKIVVWNLCFIGKYIIFVNVMLFLSITT